MANKKKYTFTKEERLSWKRYIDELFLKGQSFVAFPLRVIFLPLEEAKTVPVSVMLSIPKKKIKKANRRNLIKRQLRETYRLRKHELSATLAEKNKSMHLAFLYIDKQIHPFAQIEKAMAKALQILREKA
jgi:ribonuclease P protein component